MAARTQDLIPSQIIGFSLPGVNAGRRGARCHHAGDAAAGRGGAAPPMRQPVGRAPASSGGASAASDLAAGSPTAGPTSRYRVTKPIERITAPIAAP